MGYLYYGTTSYRVEMDDRALAHLKIAMLTLLRAGQSLAFSFVRPPEAGSGRETLWICPTTDIRFRFNGSRAPAVNEPWVRRIIETAKTPAGMRMVSETPEAQEPALIGG